MNTRNTNDGPFCWQSKEARRLIRKRFSESGCIGSVLSIYDALSELSSDAGSESFQTSTPTIAATAGVGTRTAQSILPKLKAHGFIKIAEQTFPGTNMDAPSVYTILVCPEEPLPLSNGCAPLSNGCAPVRNKRKQSSLRTSEETEKNKEKKGSEEGAAASAAPADAGTSSLKAAVKATEKRQPDFPDPPLELTNQRGFPKAWDEFTVMRRRIRKPLTPYATELLLRKLVLRPQHVVAGLEMAIENAWQGFEWEWFDNRRSTSSGAENRNGTSDNGRGGPADPTPGEIAAWLETAIAAAPLYASKRGEWLTWNDLPPHAKERFRAFQRAQKAPQTVLV